ncbi:MAG: universal stress protein [Firmicutes bacterium]|nr:universal stress protein [Bacillota bacterium]
MKKILVAINDSELSRDLINLGAALCRNEKGELYILHILEVPFYLPLDAEPEADVSSANKILDKSLEIVEDLKIKTTADMVSARSVGGGIISYANSKNVDVIIAGHKDYPGYGDVISSPAVEYILKKATCRVMIIRQERANQS